MATLKESLQDVQILLAILISLLAIKPNTFDYLPLVFGTDSIGNSLNKA
jgi:hypothetical protein